MREKDNNEGKTRNIERQREAERQREKEGATPNDKPTEEKTNPKGIITSYIGLPPGLVMPSSTKDGTEQSIRGRRMFGTNKKFTSMIK